MMPKKRYGIKEMVKILWEIADRKSRFNIACNARWEPHPGHLNPVRDKNGHFGKKE